MKRVAVFAIVIALAAVGGWFAGRTQERDASVVDDCGAVAADPAAANAPATAAPSPAHTPRPAPAPVTTAAAPPSVAALPVAERYGPLPPTDEPIARHLDELRRRARDGDSRAACRLAMELDACRRLPELALEAKRMASMIAANPPPAPIRRRDGNSPDVAALAAKLDKACAGVAPFDDTEAFRWQQAAAQSGNCEALFRAAAMPALQPDAILDHVPEWTQYRDRALGYLEQSLALGDPCAALMLAEFYQPERRGRPRIAPIDPQRAYTYARLRTRIAEAAGESPMRLTMFVSMEGGEDLTAEQRAAAEDEAEQLFQEKFAGRPPKELGIGPWWGYDDFGACEQ